MQFSLLLRYDFQKLHREKGADQTGNRYITESIHDMDFLYGQFNLICSGTGTGKTEFIRRGLLTAFDVEPSEVLYVTSRSMIRDQQSMLDGINRYDNSAMDVVGYWNGESEAETLKMMIDSGIWIMNYNQLVHILDVMNPENGRLFQRVKIVVFDECHAIYSDGFIEGMVAVRCWLRERVVHEDMILIGLTATPDICFYYAKMAGIKTKQVNRESFVNYKAKNLICTGFERLPELFADGTFVGHSMILCGSLTDCRWLAERIPNSVVLCSARNDKFDDEMRRVREHIVRYGTLPDRMDETGEARPLNVLITTSTMREGINLAPESGIKNVVSCISDELHIKQFVGRCRFNVENLVVVQRRLRTENLENNVYLSENRLLFEKFMRGESSEWFDSLSDILECGLDDVVKIEAGGSVNDFCDMIDEKWACSKEPTEKTARMIYDDYDKQEIVGYAIQCGLLGSYPSKYSFNAVMRFLEQHGYSVESGRTRVEGVGQITYKLIHKKEQKENDE